ncbi:MAG: hypothetical protein WB812_05595 [Woeseiaceae bacterium]
MRVNRLYRFALQFTVLLLAGACSSGGSNSSGQGGGQPPGSGQPPPQAEATSITLTSDAGDFIGDGRNYSYSNVDSLITVTVSGAYLRITVEGDERWTGDFQLPDSYTELEPGSYSGLERYGFHDSSVGGLQWSGEGRTCSTLTGWVVIDNVTYDETTLIGIDLQFEQQCDGGAAALHGEIHWDANDTTTPPGPVSPPPAGLWKPASGTTPTSGNYVYLKSQQGDYIGAGYSYLYKSSDSAISASGSGAHMSISVNGDEDWIGDFLGMDTLSRLQPGYYADLQEYPFSNPTKGGLSWHGEGRGCNTVTGWFVVDHVNYAGTALESIDLRFEQFCEGSTDVLHGEIHWDANDPTTPPGPVVPPPADLWEPAPGVTSATGNYVYLESDPGDFVGVGGTYLYTQANSLSQVTGTGALLSVSIKGDEDWTGKFQGMYTLSRLQVGYYGDLQAYPGNNPAKGGLTWFGEGRGCNTVTGWFVVDQVTYSGTTLQSIDLRFAQHCEGDPSVLHGAIHWDVDDPTTPPGPVVPPPAGLWEPAAGVVPATGNYVYLESDTGEYIGLGNTYLYTPYDSLFNVYVDDTGALQLFVNGDQTWSGQFQPMYNLGRFEVGYYGDLQRYPFNNPAKGGLDWYGEGRGCNNVSGWFVVDSVTYDGDTLVAIDLRFELHCGGSANALHGEIHWDANDATTPPGPVVPPPAGLWEPAAGTTPASGNYVYLESEPGDELGGGMNYLYMQANALISLDWEAANLWLQIMGDESWSASFNGMAFLSELEVGYYGNLYGNPVAGGLDWSVNGEYCGSTTGWFVIDSVTYDGSTLKAIDLRFEQHCNGGVASLHGKFHWDASDTTSPPGPVEPPPAGLWEPATGTTPTSGDYVYLESEPGDFIGAGETYLYVEGDSVLSANTTPIHLSIDVDQDWQGEFITMDTVSRFEPGYYGDLRQFVGHNPARGGLDWQNYARSCSTLTGWFVVESVNYEGDKLVGINLRFEQHCNGDSPALHGVIHWTQ